ncbi:MAG: SDR family oxidoreductase [Desulfobacterium sp.]|nr:SDR family oxidoreductase [Desulfobacterium sp.]
MRQETGKTILITGAASGIGRATALFFAKQGWYVALTDIAGPLLADLAAEIGENRCCFHVMDVADIKSVSQAMDLLGPQLSYQLDVLFNCAGILKMGPHHGMDIQDQHLMVDVNLKGILNCIHASFSMLRQTKGACIINMSSASSVYGTPELAVYSATKFAVRGLTEALNIEYEPLGITVCDVAAAYVRTPMILEAGNRAVSVEKLGVRIEPIDVAKSVWKSAHGTKVHRQVGLMTRLSSVLVWAFPFAAKQITKWVAFSPEKSAKI